MHGAGGHPPMVDEPTSAKNFVLPHWGKSLNYETFVDPHSVNMLFRNYRNPDFGYR